MNKERQQQLLDNISTIDFSKFSVNNSPSFNRHFREKNREHFLKPLAISSQQVNRHFRDKDLERFIKPRKSS